MARRATLTATARRWASGRFGSRATLTADARAGTVLGLESVPDGLAAGLLAGVNPVAGLYAYMIGTIAGALTTSSVLMTVQATGAMAVIISDVPQTQTGDAGATQAITLLAVLTGLGMLALGVARLGSLVRFVSNSVLVGFVNAVAVNIVLSQLDEITGFTSDAANRVLRAVDTVAHVAQWEVSSLVVASTTIALIVALERTRLGALAMVVAIVASSALPLVLDLARPGMLSVPVLGDITAVPRSLPALDVPDLSLVGALVVPALSLVFVGLVQGAAISGTVPNPDGRAPDPSGDFRGQGLANVATGLLQGMPVAGSMSATSLVRTAGARTATANLVAGAVMALAILLVSDLLGLVAMPALGGLLALVGFRSLRVDQLVLTWRTGSLTATVMAVTFVLTLVVPLQYAVLVGVGLSVVLHVARQSNRVVVRQWVFDDEGGFPTEVDPPATLAPGEVVVLATYGSLFFAAAPLFEAQLPRAAGPGTRSVVVLRLRAKDELGSTVVSVLSRYAAHLAASDARLLLAGVSPTVRRQLVDTGLAATLGPDAVFDARARLGRSVGEARQAAARWLADPGSTTGPGTAGGTPAA